MSGNILSPVGEKDAEVISRFSVMWASAQVKKSQPQEEVKFSELELFLQRRLDSCPRITCVAASEKQSHN